MNTNKFLELYATYVWPIVRKFVKISKRCNHCIVSEKYVPLKNGLCEACSKNKLVGKESFEVSTETINLFQKTISSYVQQNNRYDAILLLSGGKDSAYILHRMKEEYPKLKMLALMINNGFSSQIAIQNAKNVAEKLKTDLFISNANIDDFAKAFRQGFLNLNGRGSSGVVDFIDGQMIFQIGQHIAFDMKIPLVIGGLSWTQVQNIVGIDSFELNEREGVKLVFPLAVWRTNEQEIRKKVRDLGLIPKGSDSPIVSNNQLITAMSAIDVLNNGYCSFEPEFAQMIREGKTDRKVWLHVFELLEFATTRGFLNKELKKTLAKLNLLLSDIVKEKI